MSTSLLYHGFGIRGYRYLRTEYINGHVYFTVEMKPDQIRCSACNCRQVVRRGTVERRFRTLPIGKKTRCRRECDNVPKMGTKSVPPLNSTAW